MPKRQVRIWPPPAIVTAVEASATAIGRSLSVTICEMFQKALDTEAPEPIDPDLILGLVANVRLLDNRTKYLVRSNNMIMRHHPEVNLLDIMKQVDNAWKGASHG